MITDVKTKVAELSATLPPINSYNNAIRVSEAMYEIAEDSNSYNSSFYCDGWIKPCYEGDFRGSIIVSVGEYQVIRHYYISMKLEGYAYNEIPEEWDDEPEFNEPEILEAKEYKQIWIDRNGQVEELETMAYSDYHLSESFVVCINSLQPWIYEPKLRDILINQVSEETYTGYDSVLEYTLSPIAEYLDKNAPIFAQFIREEEDYSFVKRFAHSLRIAIRHHYALPTDLNTYRTYRDYLNMINNIGRDTHNPQFICPQDVFAEHARLIANKEKLQLETLLNTARQYEETFDREHAYLKGISFDNGHFKFTSLDSAEAYIMEGFHMHHCIGRCKYYEKHDVLSMHVSDLEGNRVATCSINVKRGEIVELQTLCNDPVWREGNEYKEIWNVLQARMHTFPRRSNKQQLLKTA